MKLTLSEEIYTPPFSAPSSLRLRGGENVLSKMSEWAKTFEKKRTKIDESWNGEWSFAKKRFLTNRKVLVLPILVPSKPTGVQRPCKWMLRVCASLFFEDAVTSTTNGFETCRCHEPYLVQLPYLVESTGRVYYLTVKLMSSDMNTIDIPTSISPDNCPFKSSGFSGNRQRCLKNRRNRDSAVSENYWTLSKLYCWMFNCYFWIRVDFWYRCLRLPQIVATADLLSIIVIVDYCYRWFLLSPIVPTINLCNHQLLTVEKSCCFFVQVFQSK